MIRIDLSHSECNMLMEILESTLSNLRMEIADTDRFDYREMLKERKRVLEKTMQVLAKPSAEV